MAAGYKELFLEQGASFATSLTLADVNGEAYNLVNYTANSDIRKSYYSSNVTASFVSSIDTSNGVITLTIDTPKTSNIAPGRYLYDVKIISKTDAANDTIRVLEGIINILPSVTKS